MLRLLFIILWVLGAAMVTSQADSSIVIDEIVIRESVRDQNQQNALSINVDRSISLADAIGNTSNIFVKNYGSGSLSTLSIRGASAGQSLILWNGLPLQSPMLGLLDLSLIPSTATEKITINKGGNTTLWGSGAVSGVVKLDSEYSDDHTLSAKSTIGNYGLYMQIIKLSVGSKKWKSTTKYIREAADRNFEYERSPTLPMISQQNAHYNRNHIIQDIYFLAKPRHQFAAHIWAYNAYTEIPATTVQNLSEAYQNDRALRTNVEWKYTGSNIITQARFGYFIDHNDFFDPSIKLETQNRFNIFFADVNAQFQIQNHSFSIGSTHSRTVATAEGYNNAAEENKTAIFGNHKMDWNALAISTALRQEIIDDNYSGLMPSVRLLYNPRSNININSSISRDFRNPTLNDKFWNPGGNEDLQPESGWSKEIGIQLSTAPSNISVEYSTTYFHRDMKNWILWSPNPNGPFWSAQNINNVVSQGVEQRLTLSYNTKKIETHLNLAYDYISSAFQSAMDLPKVDAGDQLIYTPKHNGRIRLDLISDNWRYDINHNITGASRAVNGNLPAYHVTNTSITHTSSIEKYKYSISLTLNNMLNSRYFIIERRPIMGRNIQIGFSLKH